MLWIGFIWHMIVNMAIKLQVPQNTWAAEQLVASQEGLSSICKGIVR
jgi:hypothetical protein